MENGFQYSSNQKGIILPAKSRQLHTGIPLLVLPRPLCRQGRDHQQEPSNDTGTRKNLNVKQLSKLKTSKFAESLNVFD